MSTTAELPRSLEAMGLSRVVFGREEIARCVEEMGRDISDHYGAERRAAPGGAGPGEAERPAPLLIVGVLKGAFIFVADLVRAVDLPVEVDFLIAASYGSSTETSGRVKLLHQPEISLEGRDVLLVEDIVDTGTTLERIVPRLEARRPRSLEICALLDKRRDEGLLEPRWVGFEAPDEFLVGYGLDYGESFRHLPFIATLNKSESSVRR